MDFIISVCLIVDRFRSAKTFFKTKYSMLKLNIFPIIAEF